MFLTLVGVLRPEGGSAFHFLYLAFLMWKSATMTTVQTTMIPTRAASRMSGVERAWSTWTRRSKEDKEKNGDRGTWTNGRGSSEDEVGGRGSARCASKVKSAKQLERLVAGSEEWSSRRSRLEVEVKTFPSGDKLLM